MTKSVKMKMLIMIAMIALPFTLGGCKKKPPYPMCKNDTDCRVDAEGNEINGVCYMGKCEECVEDADCPDLKQCISNRCEGACQIDADCGMGSHCEAGICVEDCLSDDACFGDQVCVQGRCIFQAEADYEEEVRDISKCQGIAPVRFAFDSFEVQEQNRESLQSLATCLENNPEATVRIAGHTDERGTPSYNMVLGQKRADAVKTYLNINWGIASGRIKTLSYGEQQPLVNESNKYAWQQNRRAEISVENL